jgi:hypothetical protein
LITNTLIAAESKDIEGLIDKCAQGDWDACRKLDAAVGKLTDQAVLAKIAVQDKVRDVRLAAVKKLTDQAVLAKFALEELDIGRAAVGKLTDQALLAKIAVEGKYDEAREAAVEKLTDQALLAKIAEQEESRFIRAKAVAAMDESNPALKRWAGDLSALTSDTVESIARFRLAIHEPRITNRFPKVIFLVALRPYYQEYFSLNGTGDERTMSGELVRFTLNQATVTLALKDWGTNFPAKTKDPTFLAAQVHGEDLLAELLDRAEFTQGDLAELSSSEIPELRQAAVANLTDQAVLAKVAVEDKVRDVRLAAVKKLTDQELLARVALEAGDSDTRQSASGKVTDQALRAKIGINDKARATSELRRWLKWLALVALFILLVFLVFLTKSLLRRSESRRQSV